MHILNSKRIWIDRPVTIGGTLYPHLYDENIRLSLGVEEIPEPSPPEDYSPETYVREDLVDFPYVIYKKIPPTAVTAVTAAQGGIALIRMGLMEAVQEAVASPDTPPEVRWAWDKATVWDKNSPALAYLADKTGITTEQMDQLFDLAKTIVA